MCSHLLSSALNTMRLRRPRGRRHQHWHSVKKTLRFPEEKTYVGVLEWWATNSVGEVEEPCTVQLVAAGKNGTNGHGKSIFYFCILFTERSDRSEISRIPFFFHRQRSCSQYDMYLLYLIINSRNIDRTTFCSPGITFVCRI